jgi:hypothetical protein
MSRLRHGYTLLEVTVASLIFVMAVGAMLQTITASRVLESQAVAQDDASTEAERVLKVIAEDIGGSAWYLPTSEDFNRNLALDAGEDLNGNTAIDAIVYSNQSMNEDRQALYFPYVQLQDTGGLAGGLGSRYRHTHRPASAVLLPQLQNTQLGNRLNLRLPGNQGDATRLFGGNDAAQDWNYSFFARSQEIIFLKAVIGSWNPSLDEYGAKDSSGNPVEPRGASYAAAIGADQTPPLNFEFFDANNDGVIQDSERLTRQDWQTTGNQASLGVLFPSGWEATTDGSGAVTGYNPRNASGEPYGAVLDAGWYDPEAESTDEDMPIKVQWDTIDLPTMSAADYAPERLREYTYAVVPTPFTDRFGRLVRAHKVRNVGALTEGYELGNVLPCSATSSFRMRIDRVISDDVTRIVFDTYRTVDRGETEVLTLAPNQVRVRVYIAIRQTLNPDVILTRVATTVMGMRARSSATEVNAVLTALGTAPVGIEH